MPCNAIATARAQVTQETLRKLLTDKLVSNVVFEFLRRKYANILPLREEKAWSGVDFTMGSYRIHIQNGAVIVTAGWSGGDSKTCKAIADAITGFLTKTAGIIFQSQVRHAVAMKYGIQDEQRASNGALVLSVEL